MAPLMINPASFMAALIVIAVTALEGVNVHAPVIVGTMACESAGALSDVMKVAAEPLTAASPTMALGLALEIAEVDTAVPLI